MSRRPRRKAFSGLRKEKNIAISMDGKTGIPGACFFAMGWKGCWRDNVFVERIWRSIKYEEVYLRAYESVHQARTSLRRYIEFYNQIRPHSSLKGKTPIRSTSTTCQSHWQPNPDRTSTSESVKSVQTNQTTSWFRIWVKRRGDTPSKSRIGCPLHPYQTHDLCLFDVTVGRHSF